MWRRFPAAEVGKVGSDVRARGGECSRMFAVTVAYLAGEMKALAARGAGGVAGAVDPRSSPTPTWLRIGIDQDMPETGCCRKMVYLP